MPRILPFDGYLVSPAHAAAVVSPAFDAVSPQMRREFADAHPNNYINTMRQLADFPADAQPSVDELLQYNKTNLRALLTGGAFNRIETPSLFVYQLSSATHTQTGVVCEVSVDEYARGRVRKHENTRSDKEDLLAMYQQVVGVASSPICLAYRHDATIEALLAELTRAQPALDFASEDGVVQRIWRIDDAHAQRRLQEHFARIETTYLTDGHHRAAAGWRYAKMRRGGDGDGGVHGTGDGDDIHRHPRSPHHRHPRSLLSGGGDGGDGDGDGEATAGASPSRHAGRSENKERSDYIFRRTGISCLTRVVAKQPPSPVGGRCRISEKHMR